MSYQNLSDLQLHFHTLNSSNLVLIRKITLCGVCVCVVNEFTCLEYLVYVDIIQVSMVMLCCRAKLYQASRFIHWSSGKTLLHVGKYKHILHKVHIAKQHLS